MLRRPQGLEASRPKRREERSRNASATRGLYAKFLFASRSPKSSVHRAEFRQVTRSLARYRTGQFCGPAILFCIFGRDDFDFDHTSGLGERGDADNRPCRHIGLTAAEELRVA